MFLQRHLLFLWNGGLDPANALPEDLRERRTLAGLIILAVPLGLIVIAMNISRGLHADNTIIGGGLVFVVSALYVQAALNAPRLAANMSVFGFWSILVLVMSTSGLLGQTWLWLFAVPAVGTLLAGFRSGVVWAIVSAVTIWTFAILQMRGMLGLDEQVQVFDDDYILGLASEGSLVFLLLCIAVLVFRFLEKVAQQRLEETVNSLEQEVQHRTAAEAEARASEQSKSAFLAAMSHELRTPLNGVIGALQLLQESSSDSEKAEYAGVAKQSGETLLELINNIMDLSSLESGAISLERTTFDLHELADSTLAPFKFQAEKKGLNFTIDRDEAVPRYVVGDPTRLRQVMINLVGNALKFTAEGAVQVCLSGNNNQLVIQVIDSGIGISESAQTSLFEPYVQADASTTRKFGGSGLGLSIVKKLITAMGGSISVESTPGQGATFTVKLGIQVAETAPVKATSVVADRISPLNILIADDNAVNRMVLSRLLEKDQHAVVSVNDGRDVLQYTEFHDVDIVLMDIQMPEIDGISATKLIRQRQGHKGEVPIVAITANTLPDEVDRIMEAGMNDYIAKPFLYEKVQAALSRYVASPN